MDLPANVKNSRGPTAFRLVAELGRAFADLPVLTMQLLSIIQAMCDATVCLDQYHRNKKVSLLNIARASQEDLNTMFNALADVRIAIQHSLLSLSAEEDFEIQSATPVNLTHRIYCLTLLIYSDFVIFATPVQSGIRGRLAKELLQCLVLAMNKDFGLPNGFLGWAGTAGRHCGT